MAADNYTVRLDTFEGPLDLLLHLVKSNEVDIYHLPIRQITDQYLEYVGMMEELNLDVAGEYLVMAASLMYLKSRLLLPVDEEEEEEGAEDPAADLVRQLAEYQRYREVADELRDRRLLGRDVFRREPTAPERPDDEEQEIKNVDMGGLLEALRRVLARAAARVPHHVDDEEYNVGDSIKRMIGFLRGGRRVTFDSLFETDSPRGLIIATFIGLLELIKMRVVAIQQDSVRDPVHLWLTDVDVDEGALELIRTYGPAGGAVKPNRDEDAEAEDDRDSSRPESDAEESDGTDDDPDAAPPS